MKNFEIAINLEEHEGLERNNEPVRIGVPVSRGLIFDAKDIVLIDQFCDSTRLQTRPLSFWPDRSIKWLLLDFVVTLRKQERIHFNLTRRVPGKDAFGGANETKLIIAESSEGFAIDTGLSQFVVPRNEFRPFLAVRVGDIDLLCNKGSQLRLYDQNQFEYTPVVESLSVEEIGPLRCSILSEGHFVSGKRDPLVLFKARISFFAGSAVARLEFQMRNPRAAVHPGGLWDLGDPGSIFFRDLSLHFYPAADIRQLLWCAESKDDVEVDDTGDWVLYQDSSGGENWDSSNHLDQNGTLSVLFRGYHVDSAQNGQRNLIARGNRSTPYAKAITPSGWACVTVKDFWQNFPKALRKEGDRLSLGLFPRESKSGFELQGGEQKRHVILLEFGLPGQKTVIPQMQLPLHAWVDPAWVEETKAIPSFVAAKDDVNELYTKYINNVVEGPNSFFVKREKIDEYGWRNFGDIYADHEAVNHKGSDPLISHYNNQYDFIYGAFIQFLRTGDRRWYQLMDDSARHTIDIDIYHTDEDKAAYNHGLFWHTDHYKDAGISTHRTYSAKNGKAGSYGGGPSNEHNYTSGLLHYFYLTGDQEAADAVLELADWVIGMDDGSRTLLGVIDEGPSGKASSTSSALYHKPGRGAGNSINALIDAYRLSNDRRYMTKAEELVQRCIHPQDDVAALRLGEPEHKWSYLVFLQVLGKYLDAKLELGEIDYFFFYSRDSLLHYADWMVENELPYKNVLHKVEIPTETWPAHDIRKCHVFHLAAKYGPREKRSVYAQKAEAFFERCLNDLLSFETAYVTRPMVILTVYGSVHSYFQKYGYSDFGSKSHNYDFGQPLNFMPQKARVKRQLQVKTGVIAKEVKRFSLAQWYTWKSRITKAN